MTVAVLDSEGEVGVHLPACSFGEFETLCGLPTDDAPGEDLHQRTSLPDDSRVTCQACYSVWKVAIRYTSRDFSKESRVG